MVRQVTKNQMIVITPSDRFEIKYEEDPTSPTSVAAAIPVPGVPNQKRSYKCPRCKARFERSYQLKRHNFVAHPTETSEVAQPTTAKAVLVKRELNSGRKTQSVVLSHANLQSKRDLQIKSLPKMNASKPTPKPAVHKNPVFPYSSFRKVDPNTKTQTLPQIIGCTLSFASNTPKPSAAINKISLEQPLNHVIKPTFVYPRIVVRKEPAGQAAKFDESTKDEWSQIVYEVSSATSGVIFKCAVCDRAYTNLVAMDSHLQCHNGQAFRYKCELCDEFVASVTHLRKHVHSHTCSQQMPIKCDRCEHRFADQAKADAHDCQSEPSTICQLCRQTFLTDSLLKSHHFLHSRVKPYKCDSCDTHFIHLSALAKHREIENLCSIITNRTSDNACILGI